VISAIAAAQGTRTDSYKVRSILLRGSVRAPQAAVVNLNAILKGRAANFHLQPGDILWVPKQPWHKLEEYAKLAAESAATSIAVQQSYDHFTDDDDDDGDVTVNVSQDINVTPVTTVETTPEPAAVGPVVP
jgi:hypothetical protein